MTPAEYNQLKFLLNDQLAKSQLAIHNELERFEAAYLEIMRRYLVAEPPPNPTPEPPPSQGVLIALNWGQPPVDTRGTSASIGHNSTTTVVGRLVVPLGAQAPLGQPGVISVVEYDGPIVERVVSLSTQANDFRGWQPGLSVLPPTDPTGVSAPLDWGVGVNANVYFLLSGTAGTTKAKLTPGQTYYLNLRTIYYSSGQPSCTASSCNVRITVNPPR